MVGFVASVGVKIHGHDQAPRQRRISTCIRKTNLWIFLLDMKVQGFPKHQSILSDTDRYKWSSSIAHVSLVDLYTMNRTFGQL